MQGQSVFVAWQPGIGAVERAKHLPDGCLRGKDEQAWGRVA